MSGSHTMLYTWTWEVDSFPSCPWYSCHDSVKSLDTGGRLAKGELPGIRSIFGTGGTLRCSVGYHTSSENMANNPEVSLGARV